MPGPPNSPSALDLTDLETVKGWLGSVSIPVSSADDNNIQLCITAASLWWLAQTGLGLPGGGDTASPLNSVVSYTEFYDGNGSNTLYVRNQPIVAISSLLISGVTIPQSTAWGLPGWVIDQDRKSIRLRWPGGGNTMSFTTIGWPIGFGGQCFAKGVQNVQVTYTAGYAALPIDIQWAVTVQVGVHYKRKEWLDVSSRAMANGAGTTSFRAWRIPPEVQFVLTRYTRTALY